MKKKNYVGKAVMLGALLAPIGLPTVCGESLKRRESLLKN